jgi:hypothetical protein
MGTSGTHSIIDVLNVVPAGFTGEEFGTIRPLSEAGLCGCSCHSSCPVTMPTGRMTVPMATWYQTCTCPGAEPARRDMPDALIRFRQPRGLRERIKVLYRLIQAGG